MHFTISMCTFFCGSVYNAIVVIDKSRVHKQSLTHYLLMLMFYICKDGMKSAGQFWSGWQPVNWLPMTFVIWIQFQLRIYFSRGKMRKLQMLLKQHSILCGSPVWNSCISGHSGIKISCIGCIGSSIRIASMNGDEHTRHTQNLANTLLVEGPFYQSHYMQ